MSLLGWHRRVRRLTPKTSHHVFGGAPVRREARASRQYLRTLRVRRRRRTFGGHGSTSPHHARRVLLRRSARANYHALHSRGDTARLFRHLSSADKPHVARKLLYAYGSLGLRPPNVLKKYGRSDFRQARKVERAGLAEKRGAKHQPSQLGVAIDVGTTVAPVGVAVDALRGARVAEEVVRAERAAKTTKTVEEAGRLRRAEQRLGSRVKSRVERVKRTPERVKTAPTRAVKKVKRTPGRAREIAKDPRGAAKAYALRHPVKAAAGVALVTTPQGRAIVKGHEQAIIHHPKRTLKTTARAIPGLVTAPIAQAGAVGLSAYRAARAVSPVAHKSYSGKEIAAPTVAQAKALADFSKRFAKTMGSGDPKKIEKSVEQEYGLTAPIVVGAVGTRSFREPYRGIRDSTRRAAERGRAKRGTQRRPPTEEPQHVSVRSEHRAQRKHEAGRAATTRSHTVLEAHQRLKGVLKHAKKARGPSETVRRLPGGKKLRINPGDAVGFLARHGISRKDPLPEIRRIKTRLDKGGLPEDLPLNRLNTHDLLTYLTKHPEVLKDKHLWQAVDHYKAQAKTLSTSERARLQPVASEHGVPLPEERFPHLARDVVRAEPTPGKAAKDVLARESRSDRRAAVRLNKKAATREARARAVERELAVRERVEPGRAVTGRARERAQRYRNQAAAYRRQAEKATERAKLKQKALKVVRTNVPDRALESEYAREVQGVIAKHGLEQPAYATHADVRSKGAGFGNYPSGIAPKVKQRKGTLQQMGAVHESLGALLGESIRVPVARKHIYAHTRDFFNEVSVKHDGKEEFTSREAGKLFDQGVADPKQVALIDRGQYKRAFDQLENGNDAPLHNLLSESPRDPEAIARELQNKGRRYRIVPRESAEEFFAQMQETAGKRGGLERAAGQVNRVTSRAILGTSPAWAAMQFLAEGAQALSAVNPYRMARGVRALSKVPPEDQLRFAAVAGETPGVVTSPKDIQVSLRDSTAKDMNGAFTVMNKTLAGRAVKTFGQAEWLGMVDRWKGARYRRAVLTGAIDRHLNGYFNGVRRLWRFEEPMMKELSKKPLHEQLAWMAEHPAELKKFQSYLDDVMGNWNALTRHERLPSSVMIFYPFIRMSLRWAFWAFPKRHPVKASMLYYLGQANASELHKMLHGDPSFWAQWATGVVQLGDGKVAGVDLSRVAPGSNALIEALGGSSSQGTAGAKLLRVTQPWLGATVTALTGVDPLSGKQAAHAGANALGQLLSLPAPVRAIDALHGPKDRSSLPIVGARKKPQVDDPIGRYLASLQDSGKTKAVKGLGFPLLPENPRKLHDRALASRLLARMGNGPDDSEIAKARTKAERVALRKRQVDADRAKRHLDELISRAGINPRLGKTRVKRSFEAVKPYPSQGKTKKSSPPKKSSYAQVFGK